MQKFETLLKNWLATLRVWVGRLPWSAMRDRLREIPSAQTRARLAGLSWAPLRDRIRALPWAAFRDKVYALARGVPEFAGRQSRYARLMRWHQPIGIWLLLWPTLWGLWIAGEGRPDERILIVFVLGTIVLRSAGCIINDFADRRIDPLVARTADRPLATGEVTSAAALMLFAGLMLVALGLVLTLNRLTVQLAIVGAVIAVVYPFTKRVIATPQFVLGIAFAWGVPMAFAAELGTVPRLGWLLFLAAVIWGVVYDTQYAMADREDDLKAGVRSTAILFGELDRTLVGGLQLLLFLALLLVGVGAGLGAWYYGGIALAAGLAIYQQYLIADRDPERCLRAFKTNAWLGGWVFAGLLLDYLFR